MSAATPSTVYLKNYQPADFIIDSIHLHFELGETETEVKAILAMQRNPKVNTSNAPLRLDGEHMELQQVLIDGKALAKDQYQVDASSLTIDLVDDAFILETVVLIKPQENKSLHGLYQSRNNFCTQCEAQGFRNITYFLDRPDVMTRFTTTITADKEKYPYLLSNGNLVEKRDLSHGRHWVRWHDPSLKPCYLFALVAGDFDVIEDKYKTMSGRLVDLHLYLEKGFGDQGDYALASLKQAMAWDERTYGREYELNIYMIVAVSDFNMGAMENKGLNVFNTKYVLAKPDTATDQDYTAILDVVGHEYFHNWTGNRITCRDWFQLTLKEGLTVFRDQTFSEDLTSAGVARLNTVSVVRNQQFPEDAGPIAHPIRPRSYMEINNFYTNTVYRKGAEVIRMIRTLIGHDSFQKAMDIYFERFDEQAVTTEDFISAMEAGSGRDLTQFKRWYDQAGTPVLDINAEYDSQAATLILNVRQSTAPTPGQTEKSPLHLPLAVGFISSACAEMDTQLQGESTAQAGTRVLEITQAEQSFTFVHVTESPTLSLLRGFSAPVKLNYEYSDEELLWLLRCDRDPFSRFEAGQIYLKRYLLKLLRDKQAGKDFAIDKSLIETYHAILAGDEQDLQYLSSLLCLPPFTYLLQQEDVADLDGLVAAREFVQYELATKLKSLWMKYYQRCQTPDYDYNMPDVGKRAMKNLSLAYLTATREVECLQLAYKQFQQADNMTDRMGALLALNHHECDERSQALDAFYQQFKEQPLVVNKWLMLLATSLNPNTLESVRSHVQHPAFDKYNPNDVYSLLCAFGANIPRFHDISGAGYQFITDMILEIDPINPQVAGRLLLPLTRWAQYDVTRQKLMKEQLKRILQCSKLSRDIYELVTKSLVE